MLTTASGMSAAVGESPLLVALALGRRAGRFTGARKAAMLDRPSLRLHPRRHRRVTRQLDRWGYPYDIVQLRWTKGDDGAPDETVDARVRDWNAKYAWPKLIMTTA